MLHELLRRAAAEVPDRVAVDDAGGTTTYAAWRDRAEAVARGLRDRGVERVGCRVDRPADAMVVLAGASLAGVEACVYPRALDDDGVRALAERLGHAAVVTDGPADLGPVAVVPAGELPAAGEPVDPVAASPVVILTTGSTGEQKGAEHDWSRLAGAVRRTGDDAGTAWLLAYNLNQFAGIQVVLHVLAHRGTLVVPASSQARDVVDAMRRAATTHVSATPTFWRLLVGGLDDELLASAPLRQITLGGEAAPGPLLDRLRGLFPAARITHVYAGTEFGSAVAVSDGLPGMPLSVLHRPDDADVRLRVVDGELHVASRVGMRGYRAAPDGVGGLAPGRTGEAAPGAGPDGTPGAVPGDHDAFTAGGVDGDWRPTGDLVEERDGRLHVVGRTSEVINVGGAKVHPLPIEELVQGVDGVAHVAAYGRKSPVTGQIVALDVVLADGGDRDEVDAAIRAATASLPAPGRPRRIRFVEALETRGSKLVRGGTGPARVAP